MVEIVVDILVVVGGGGGVVVVVAVEKICGRHLKYSYNVCKISCFTSKKGLKVQQNRFFSHL